jgi:hypothetical protein
LERADSAVSQARTLNDVRLPAAPASNLYLAATRLAVPPRFAAFTARCPAADQDAAELTNSCWQDR